MKKILSITIAVMILLTTVTALNVSAKDTDIIKTGEAHSGKCGKNVTWSLDTSSCELVISGTGDMEDYYSSDDVPWYDYRSQIKTVIINYGVTSIGECAFEDCTGLTSIAVNEDNKNYSSQDGVLFNKDKTQLIKHPIGNARTSYIIPNSVTSIDDYAFEDCTRLTSITIPNSVTNIGGSAFYNTAYYNNESNWVDKVLYIGDYLIEAKSSIIGNCKIKESTKCIADRGFSDCTGLTSIAIPNSITSIGDSAFHRCTGLTSITIPDSVTNISTGAFARCTGLKSITISDSVTSIGDYAFYYCTGLKSITIPNSVTSIGDFVFESCTDLKSITIPNRVTSIGGFAFEYCSSLTNITIPKSVKNIGDAAFYYCGSLKDAYYTGSKSDWSKISIGLYNESLKNSTIHCYGTDVTIKKTKATIYVKGTVKVSATVKNGKGTTSYKTSNAKVAKVSAKGVVTGVKAGKAKITVKNNGVSKVFTVTVKNPVIKPTSKTLKKGQSFTIKITGKVGKAIFTSSNKKIATVNNKGKVVAKKRGKAAITVKTNGNIKLKCTIIVR